MLEISELVKRIFYSGALFRNRSVLVMRGGKMVVMHLDVRVGGEVSGKADKKIAKKVGGNWSGKDSD